MPSQTVEYSIPPETVARIGGPAQVRLLLADTRQRTPTPGRIEQPADVRLATIRDEPELLDLFIEDIIENGTRVASTSIERIMHQIHCGTRGKGGFVPVIDGEHGIVAAAIVVPTEWWYSRDVFLQEVVLYVRPAGRKTRAAAHLLDYQRWLGQEMSDKAGYQIFALAGVTATKDVASKCRLYRRHMSQVGAFFISPAVDLAS